MQLVMRSFRDSIEIDAGSEGHKARKVFLAKIKIARSLSSKNHPGLDDFRYLDICWKWMKFQWRYVFMLQWTIKKEEEGMEIICENYISSADCEKGFVRSVT